MENVSKQVQEAVKAHEELALRENQYRNIIRINHCLPKHKAKKFDAITTGYLVRRTNARNAFKVAIRKLRTDELPVYTNFVPEYL